MDDCTKFCRVQPAAITYSARSLSPAGWVVVITAALVLMGFVVGAWWGRG